MKTKLLLIILFSLPTTYLIAQSTILVEPRPHTNSFNEKISNDGNYTVFISDLDTESVFELYKISINSGEPIKLSLELEDVEDDVISFKITSNNYIVYNVAKKPLLEYYGELYSVSIDGGESVQLSNTNARFTSYKISPDGNYLVYRSGQSLYSVPVIGGEKIAISNKRVRSGSDEFCNPWVGTGSTPIECIYEVENVGLRYVITPDSKSVIYSDVDSNEIIKGAINEISQTIIVAPDDNIETYKLNDYSISSDGEKLVYSADDKLYSTTLNEITLPVELLDSGLAFLEPRFKINSDGNRVIFKKETDFEGFLYGATFYGTNDDLFSVDINGGNPINLNEGIVQNPSGNNINDFIISSENIVVFEFNKSIYKNSIESQITAEKLVENIRVENPIGLFELMNNDKTILYTKDIQFDLAEEDQYYVYGELITSYRIRSLFSRPISGGEETHITSDDTNAGHSIYSFDNHEDKTVYGGTSGIFGSEGKGLYELSLNNILSITDIGKNSFKLYPNPTNDFLFIENITDINIIEIYNSQGKIIKKDTYKGVKELDLSSLNNGVYLIKIKTDKGYSTYKILKK